MAYKVLILDCNEYEREKYKINLGNIGKFSFAELSNPKDFFVIQKHLEDFSLIILDLEFPTTNDGFSVLQALSLNSKLSLTPVIIVSREDTVYNKTKAMTDYHVKDYVIKPYTQERLSNSIKTFIPSDAQFFYSFENTSIITMPVEEYISHQLILSKRADKDLSIIFISPNLIKISESTRESIFNDYKTNIYENILKYIKLTIRISDIVLLVNKTDIVVLLHFTSAIGASGVAKKIKTSINIGLKDFDLDFENLFYLSTVTFPEDGEDINKLMQTAIKRTNSKSALDKIVSVSRKKFDEARASYKKYS